MNRVLLLLTLAALVTVGCAHTPVQERLTTYHGEVLDSDGMITFDGEAFHAPGREPIHRRDVQSVEWQADAPQEPARGRMAGVEALTDLAESMLPAGQALAEVYPGVQGVVLVDDGVFEYFPDGTSRFRYHYAALVLREEMKSAAQLTLGFTHGRSRVGVEFARSIAPDGTIQSLAPEDMEEGSPSEEMAFFNPTRRVFSGVIPGVEVGSIVEYVFESERYNPEDPRIFFPGWFFQGTEPVAMSRVKVSLPTDVPFNYVVENLPEEFSSEPEVSRTGGRVEYVWETRDMPPLVEEPMMPPHRDLVPRMESSVWEDYEATFEFVRRLQEARMRVTPDIEELVSRITADAGTVDEKLARIYHWVQENTRYISIKGSLGAGWSGHTAQETLENGYGDCTDKAILFGAMSKVIGVDAYPVILRTNTSGTTVTEIPTMDGNHAITEVVLGERRFFLDSTSQNFRYPYFRADNHGAVTTNAILGQFRTVSVPPPADNARFSAITATLEPNGDMAVETRNRYTGTIEAGIRGFWKQVREDDRPMQMAGYVNSISPGGRLVDFTLHNLDDLGSQLSMNIDYVAPGHAVRARDLMYLRMPSLERDYPEVALESRRFPVQYMTTEERVLHIDLAMPAGWQARWLPPPLEINSPYLEFSASYEETGDTIRYRETFRRLKRIVPVEDYAEYRDHLRAIAGFSKMEVFLMKSGSAAGTEG